MNIHIEALVAVIASTISSYLAYQFDWMWISGCLGTMVFFNIYVWAVKWQKESLQEINDLGFHIDANKKEFRLVPLEK